MAVDLEKADPVRASSTTSSDTPTVSRISLAHQHNEESIDSVMRERQRTAESIYENTVGEVHHTGSSLSLVPSRIPPEQWPAFGGGKRMHTLSAQDVVAWMVMLTMW